MSIVSECNDSNSSTLINMTELNINNMTAIEHVVSLNDNSNNKNNDLINVQRRASEVSTEWLPVSFSEIPITSNTLNIAINNSEIRPNITSMQSNTRNIAPKPVSTATTFSIPIRQDNNTTKVSGDGTQAVIITTSDSTNSTTNAKQFGKVIPISNQVALVPSPDGCSMIAVPMSSLITKGGNRYSIPLNHSSVKSKNSFITPVKVLPLIASTTASATVPTISHSKNVQTVIASMSIANTKAVTAAISTATAGGVTIIPTSVSSLSSFTSNETTPEFTATSAATITALPLETKPSVISNDELLMKPNDDKMQSPLPPLLSQNTSISNNTITNSQTLTPPALTPVAINTTNNSNNNNNNSDDSQNINKSLVKIENETNSLTGIAEMDDVLQIMEWKDGIGVLPGSDLKFRIDEFGNLDMINEQEVDEIPRKKPKLEEIPPENSISQNSDNNKEMNDSNDNDNDLMRTCINCGLKGLVQNFIRQGRFCSKSCATIQSTHLKLFTKRNTSGVSLVKEQEKKKGQSKKAEAIKVRKQSVEQTSLVYQTSENGDQPMDTEVENNEDANEEVEDVETNTGNYNDNNSDESFSWRQYLSQTNSMAAPLKCFNEKQSFPTIKNSFKVGMKLEGIDPQHPSKFCVLSVIEICGFRLRLHFDGYKELFDFWVNADHNFLFPAGYCERTHRKLEPPHGMTREEFNWNNYLQQTRAIAAPKHLFPSSVSQQTVTPNGFRVGMKLEAVDRANTALVCVATITDIIDNWLLIHFDGWDDSYDYWVETTSPYIHAINWCRTKGRSLTPPKDYHRSSERFSWEEYLSESKSLAVSPRSFKTRISNNFKVGMKLEVVDKRNPKLIRVSTVSHRQSHNIKVHFDGWDEKYDYWVDDDSPDIHPVNWCQKTGHPLQPSPSTVSDPSMVRPKDDMNSCPTAGCRGIGHIRGPKYLSHYTTVSCPYTDSRLDYELPDRLGNPSNRNIIETVNEELDENRVSPSHSPSPSESNSLNSTQKSQKALKAQHIIASNKSRKRKSLVIGSSASNNGTNGPVSPQLSTNSGSAKHSRPSTPSSVTNLSTLQQSIFAMRMSQQQQEAPICWDRHSKTSLPGIDRTKSKDVLLWTPLKVAEFIDMIPGCQTVGQIFQDELIDGEAFLLLNQNDIVKILGLKLGPAIKIYNSILVIRDNSINEDV